MSDKKRPVELRLSAHGRQPDVERIREQLRAQASVHFSDEEFHESFDHEHGTVNGAVHVEMTFTSGKADREHR